MSRVTELMKQTGISFTQAVRAIQIFDQSTPEGSRWLEPETEALRNELKCILGEHNYYKELGMVEKQEPQ